MKKITKNIVQILPSIALFLLLFLVGGASLFYLSNSDNDFLAAMADPYTCDPSTCYGNNGCTLGFCGQAGCSGSIGSCGGDNYCQCDGDNCKNVWSCTGSLSCGDAADGACPAGAVDCTTCYVRCIPCQNSARACHFGDDSSITIPPSTTVSPPPPTEDPPQPDDIYIEGHRYCMSGEACLPDSGCYCPAPSIAMSIDADTIEENAQGENIDGIATSYEDPYSFHVYQAGYNLKSDKPAGTENVQSNVCYGCSDNPNPSPAYSNVEWHADEQKYFTTVSSEEADIDVNWRYDVRAYILGRFGGGGEYWRGGSCSGCLGSCNADADLYIECTDGTDTENTISTGAYWACDASGAYYSTTDFAFTRGETITCTAHNPPDGHQFWTWDVDNLHPALSITGVCDPQSNSCSASFTADQGTLGDGNNDLSFQLVTPTPYIQVNIQNDQGDPVEMVVRSVNCDDYFGGCQIRDSYQGSTVEFAKTGLDGSAVGAQIGLEQGEIKYAIHDLDAEPTLHFEERDNGVASLEKETPVAVQPKTILGKLITSLVNLFKPGTQADMADPDSEYLVWNNAATFNTGMQSMAVVVITPAIEGNFYEGAASQASQDQVCNPPGTLVSLENVEVVAEHVDGIDTTSTLVLSDDSYNVAVDNQCTSCYDVELRLPTPVSDATNAYVCACSIEDNFTCRYLDQTSPKTGVNFFVEQFDLSSDSWWQVYSGNVYANNSIQSLVPHTLCSGDCQPALSLNDFDDITNSAGFPITNSGSIVTGSGDTTGYIHQSGDRDLADLGHATGVDLAERGYQYYFNNLEQEIDLGDGEWGVNGEKPDYTETDGSAEIYYYNGDLTIGDNTAWSVAADESIIVFVDGNLTIDDQLGTDQIVAVDDDGFIAFFASGNITISANVGYEMPDLVDADVHHDPASTTANIEGVYVADGNLIVSSRGATRDKKFIGAGTFVGWTALNLNRDFAQENTVYGAYNNMNPTSSFVFRPDLLINVPFAMKEAQIEWREVEPQKPTSAPAS
ncbi:MAG: hypothetical protein U9O78_00365 [Patescibacteria group bacterium]|nr:hypothetical protein [Patescibacteria group bacterium]